MAIHFYQSLGFEEVRARIEQHLYDSFLELQQDPKAAAGAVEQFAKALDRLFDTLEQMYAI